MQTTRRIFIAVSLTAAALALAADARVRSVLNSAREIAEIGRYEHALRIVDLGLLTTPDDPDLLAFRRQLADTAARAAGHPTPSAPTAIRPPDIENRAARPGENFTADPGTIAMIWIAPGELWLRNPLGSDDDTHVVLSRGYWLGRTEITQEQLQLVMDHLPPPSQFRGSDRPAERVTWISAMEFAGKMTDRARAAGRLPPGYEYTLPTEAQWEYACRAGATGPSPSDLMESGWFDANSGGQTHPVAQKRPNAWGLYDMHGNVLEWCADGFHGYPGGQVTDLMIGYDGPSAAMARMVRGGGWNSSLGQCRFGYRAQCMTNYAGAAVGFRLALAPVRTPAATAK